MEIKINLPVYNKLEETKDFLLALAAKDALLDQTIDTLQETINSTFWAIAEPKGISEEAKMKILSSTPVSNEEIIRACNYKTNKIDDLVVTGVDVASTGTGILVGIGLGPLSMTGAVVAGVGLYALNKFHSVPLQWEIDKKREAQQVLCNKLIQKKMVGDEVTKSLLKQPEIESKTKAFFSKPKNEIINGLPAEHPLRRYNGTASESQDQREDALEKFVREEFAKQNEKLEQVLTFMKEQRTEVEKQKKLATIRQDYKETQAAIYLSKVFLGKVFGDESFVEQFSIAANALNDIYATYKEYAANNYMMTFVMAANWANAGLMLVSLFSSKNNNDNIYTAIFKKLQQLTELIYEGFNTLQRGQFYILESLQELTRIVINGNLVISEQIDEVKAHLNNLRSNYDYDVFTEYSKKLDTATVELNTLFKTANFDLLDPVYNQSFTDKITKYVLHGTNYASRIRVLSGYNNNININDYINELKRDKSYEYHLGAVPLIHLEIIEIVPGFNPARFTGTVPNPVEWCRSFYLYYQAIIATNRKDDYVKDHLEAFLQSGRILKDFCLKYTSKSFFQTVADQFDKHVNELNEKIGKDFHVYFNNEQYYLYAYLIDYINSENKKATYKTWKNTQNKFQSTYMVDGPYDIEDTTKMNGHYYDFSVYKVFLILQHLQIVEPFKKGKIFSAKSHRTQTKYQYTITPLKFKHSNVTIATFFNVPIQQIQNVTSITVAKDAETVGKIISGKHNANFSEVLKTAAVDDNYWKIKPVKYINQQGDKTEQAVFADFLKNEIVKEEGRKRSRLLEDIKARKSVILGNVAEIATKVDKLGYLLTACTTLLEYNSKQSPAYAYQNTKLYGQDNFLKASKPNIAFAEDVFDNLYELLRVDVYNDFTKPDEKLLPFNRFKQNNIKDTYTVPISSEYDKTGYQIIRFAQENLKISVSKQLKTLIDVFDIKTDGVTNYNIESVLKEIETYLKGTMTPPI